MRNDNKLIVKNIIFNLILFIIICFCLCIYGVYSVKIALTIFLAQMVLIIVSFIFNKDSYLPDKNKTLKKLEAKSYLNNSLYELYKSINNTEDENEYKIILDCAIKATKNGKYGCVLKKDDCGRFSFVALNGYKDSLYNTSIDLKNFKLFNTNESGEKVGTIHSIFYDGEKINKKLASILEAYLLDDKNIASVLTCPIFDEHKQLSAILSVNAPTKNAFDHYDANNISVISTEIDYFMKTKKLIKNNEFLSNHDYLTTLCNRGYATNVVDNLLKDKKHFNMILCDLDHLKTINDTCGHSAGDKAIKMIAKYMKEVFYDATVARIGGDEFLIVDQSSLKLTNKRLENLNKILNDKPVQFGSYGIMVTISSGIASTSEANTFEELYDIADKRMYDIKKK